VNCVVKDAHGNLLLTLDRSSIGSGPGRLVLRDTAAETGPDAPAVIGEFEPDGGVPEPVTLHVTPGP